MIGSKSSTSRIFILALLISSVFAQGSGLGSDESNESSKTELSCGPGHECDDSVPVCDNGMCRALIVDEECGASGSLPMEHGCCESSAVTTGEDGVARCT